MDKIEIYNSRHLNFKVAISYVIFTALAVLNLYKHWFDWFWFIAAVIYVIAWLVVIIRYATFKSKVLLEITEDGIDDRYRKQFIKWSDVYNLTLAAGAVAIILEHPEDAHPKSWLGKLRCRFNNWHYGSSVYIYTGPLKGKELDNYNIMYDYMEAVERKTALTSSP